jgi:hypothetical protein
VDDDVRTELQEAAAAFRDAPRNLKDAIIKAARQGDTAAEIATAIDLTYGPDYVARIIRQAGVQRTRGRRKAPGSTSS